MLLPLLLFLAAGLPLPAFAGIAADTNKINELNAQALDLAYSDPEEALQVVRQTIRLSRKAGFTKGEIMALIRRGIVFDVTSRPAEAITAYNEALALSRKTHYLKGEGSALNNIGLIYLNQNELSKAMIHFQQAHDIFLQIRNDQMLGSISNNIAMIYQETNRAGKALDWFRKGLEYTTRADNLTEKANIYAGIADVFSGLDKQDSARYYSRLAIGIYERTGNLYYLGKSYNNLALSLSSRHQYQEAETYYLKSLDIARKIGNTTMLTSTGFNLSQNYRRTGNYERQGKLLAEIYPFISEKGKEELAFKVCLAFAQWNYHHGSLREADRLMGEYIEYHMKYFNEVNAKNLSEIEEKYEVEKKEQENRLLKKENQVQTLEINRNRQDAKITNLYWASGLFLLLVLSLLAMLRFRRKSYRKELESQKAVFEATLAERKRISFDLHDNVGSQLSYVVNNLELLNQHSRNAQEIDTQRIERTFKMSQEAIDSLRDTVWALHNSSITAEILAAKLESFALKVIDTDEIHFIFRTDIFVNKVISPEHTMHIFRIFQESVNNALKHAKATQIEVLLTETAEGKLVLEILDNGKGIDRTESPEGHYGLKNMSDRASQIGATWRIAQRATGGTGVYLEV